jgi:hypothetical protein
VGLSNQMHLLLWVEDAQGLAKFMGYFLSKLAREVAPSLPAAVGLGRRLHNGFLFVLSDTAGC